MEFRNESQAVSMISSVEAGLVHQVPRFKDRICVIFKHYCLTNFKFSVISRLARFRVVLPVMYVF